MNPNLVVLISAAIPLIIFGSWWLIECALLKFRERKYVKYRNEFYKKHTIDSFNRLSDYEQTDILKVIINQSITNEEAKCLFYIRNNKITFEQLFDLYNKNSIEIQKAKNTKRIEIETSGNQILPQNTFNSYIK